MPIFGISFNRRETLRREEEEAARTAAQDTKAFEFIERFDRMPVHKFSDYASYIAVGSEKIWAAFRACHLVASVMVKTQFMLTGKDGLVIEKPDPNLWKLFSQPNPYDSWEELIYVWAFHMKLTGNAFWLKDEMDGRGRPKNLYPLMPQNVRVIPSVKDKVYGYQYSVNGRVIEFQPDEIIHFRRPSPKDSLMGMGDVEPSAALFSDQINRDNYNEKFLENGATPSGILMREEEVADQTEWEKFKQWWNQNYRGKKNIGKTAFLNGKWSYQQLGLTAQQMQNLEKEKVSIQNIFMAMGVPLSVAGIEKATSLATARQDDINFRKNECVPLIDILIGKLNSDAGVLPAFGEGIKLDYSMSGLIDVEQTMKDYAPLFRMGALTINDLRELSGLTRTDNPLHDQYFIEGGLLPLEMAGMSEPAPADLQKIVYGLTQPKKK